MQMRPLLPGIALSILALLLMTACGQGSEPSATTSPSASTYRPPVDPPADPPAESGSGDEPTPSTPTDTPPTGPSDVIEKSRISGVLERKSGCAILDGPNGRWALVDLDPRWMTGDELVVTGIARPERGTPCAEIPYAVLDVRQAGT